jgi:hypothetical protein
MVSPDSDNFDFQHVGIGADGKNVTPTRPTT